MVGEEQLEQKMPLSHLSDPKVHNIIDLAQKMNAAFPPSKDGIDPFSPEAKQKLGAYISSPEHQALVNYIANLSKDELVELTALIWLGRGDGDDFDGLIEHAGRSRGPGDVDYIVEKSPSLPTYLSAGLRLIKGQ
ncbi:DUF3775 domain-containing protein [Glycocaulis abyssi]|uniref:DUF3775 domain-containing protein n=1 Tax=Glycocaulis abyssi TaxID=1433403 RepID=A0ABV9NCV9_9PROT